MYNTRPSLVNAQLSFDPPSLKPRASGFGPSTEHLIGRVTRCCSTYDIFVTGHAFHTDLAYVTHLSLRTKCVMTDGFLTFCL